MQRTTALLARSLFVLIVAGGTLSAQEQVTISATEPDEGRPIAVLSAKFRDNEKVAISYDDARYRNPEDVQDVTEQVSSGTPEEKKFGPRIIVPKGHPITFVYQHRPKNEGEALESVKRMLVEYSRTGSPTFTAKREGKRIIIEPESLKDEKGNVVREMSVLETRITLPSRQRTGEQLLADLCEELGKKSGFPIGVGPSAPRNLQDYKSAQGFEDQPARLILTQLLDGISKQRVWVWDLYFDPGDKSYGLNFDYVDRP